MDSKKVIFAYKFHPSNNLMKKYLLLVLVICFFQSSYSQTNERKKKFSDTEALIVSYRTLCQKAWEANDSKLANTYYDSIKNCIVGSYIDNYNFETINAKRYQVGVSNKPIFLTLTASWCAPCRAEIPALNKLIDEYAEKVNFLVLFWDVKSDLADLASKYNQKAYLIPSLTKSIDKAHTIDIAGFKSITGYPTTYLVDGNNKIIDYLTGAVVPGTGKNAKGDDIFITEEDAFTSNYNRLKAAVELLIKTNKDQ